MPSQPLTSPDGALLAFSWFVWSFDLFSTVKFFLQVFKGTGRHRGKSKTTFESNSNLKMIPQNIIATSPRKGFMFL